MSGFIVVSANIGIIDAIVGSIFVSVFAVFLANGVNVYDLKNIRYLAVNKRAFFTPTWQNSFTAGWYFLVRSR